jgi:NAD(P) transhydrogenase subunit alpha
VVFDGAPDYLTIMKKTDLVVGIPRETHERCRCVAVVPQGVRELHRRGHRVLVQRGAGLSAFYPDRLYEEAGATLVGEAGQLYAQADVVLKLRSPRREEGRGELEMLKPGAAILSFLEPLQNPDTVRTLVDRGLTGFAMELVPRIARAQSMDALSSLATVSGYRAVLKGASLLGKFFPLLMTAAGTIRPSTVLVLGAGVAGLQAIATARRLGARVEAFDTRPAVKEQVESLGARFVEMELPEQAETRYGYAREASEEFLRREREVIAARLPRTDLLVTTALVYGGKAPLLVTGEMVRLLSPGSVIVDIAAEAGGNCEPTCPGQTVEVDGVTVYGAVELPSQMPQHTSLMFSNNVLHAFHNLFAGEDDRVDLADEINREALVSYRGQLVSEAAKQVLEGARA